MRIQILILGFKGLNVSEFVDPAPVYFSSLFFNTVISLSTTQGPKILLPQVYYTTTKSQGAFHLSELTGQDIPFIMRILLLMKATQPDQSNAKQYARRKSFFIKTSWKKPISFSKWAVQPWSGRPVLTFGKRPKSLRALFTTSSFAVLDPTVLFGTNNTFNALH